MTSKVCTKCKKEKPAEAFGRDPRLRSGLKSQCKECRSAHKREWYRRNRDHVTEYNHKWRAENPDYHTVWQQENRDRINAQARERYAKDPTPHLEKRFRMYRIHREKRLSYARQYSKEHRAEGAAHQMKRKAAKVSATPAWADPDKIVVFYQKARELTQTDGVERHVDHIVPLQGERVCGLHCEDNLQILTAAENLAKNNRLLGLEVK